MRQEQGYRGQEREQPISPEEIPHHSMNGFEFTLELVKMIFEWCSDEDHLWALLYILGAGIVLPIVYVLVTRGK